MAGTAVAGTVTVMIVSMVALPATRSVNALARARSMLEHTPSLTYWRARASIAAQARAASSEGKVPSHRSTPGSSAHRRSPHCGAGPRGALVQQVRADPGQHPPAPPPQVRTVLGGEVPLQRGHHGGRDLGGGVLELLGDHPGPVGVQPTRRHRRVQPTQPGLGGRLPAGPSAARRTAVRTRRCACTAEVASTPDTIAGASSATCPSPRWHSTTVPSSSHSGSIAANRAIAASCTALAALTTRCAEASTPAHCSRDPLTAEVAKAPDSSTSAASHAA